MNINWVDIVLVFEVLVFGALLYGLYHLGRFSWRRNKSLELRAHVVSVLIDHNFREEMQFRITRGQQRFGRELSLEQIESDALSVITEEIHPEILARSRLSAEKLTKGMLCRILRNEWERIKITNDLNYELQLDGDIV